RPGEFARLLHITLDLPDESVNVLEFLLRPEITDETQLEVFAVNVAIEIEEVNLENALRSATAHRRPKTEIHHAWIYNTIERCFGEINAVRRKLLAVGAQVCGRKSDFLSQIIAMHNSSQDRVFAAKHGRGFF